MNYHVAEDNINDFFAKFKPLALAILTVGKLGNGLVG